MANAKRCECGAHLDPSTNNKLHVEWQGEVQHLDSFVPTWECRNCWRILPRKVYGKSEGMTPSQAEAVERFKQAFLKTWACGATDYEFKRCEVTEAFAGKYWLNLEVGRIGDEKTMGSVFCRNRVMVLVGRRGSYTAPLYVNGKTHNLSGMHECLFAEVTERKLREGK
mgnify:CR=1 FL=1